MVPRGDQFDIPSMLRSGVVESCREIEQDLSDYTGDGLDYYGRGAVKEEEAWDFGENILCWKEC